MSLRRYVHFPGGGIYPIMAWVEPTVIRLLREIGEGRADEIELIAVLAPTSYDVEAVRRGIRAATASPLWTGTRWLATTDSLTAETHIRRVSATGGHDSEVATIRDCGE